MRVGIVGLGLMGAAMVRRLLRAGHVVYVYNRTPSKADELTAGGAQWRDTPKLVAAESEVAITMVTDPHAVAEMALTDDGIVAGLSENAVYCDMSTVAPHWADTLAAMCLERGRRFVQAPVLGSKKQIASGELLIMAGGAKDDVAQCKKAWDSFSSKQWRVDTAGQAATAKLACNMLIAQMILGLGQSLAFASTGGVDPSTLLDILQSSGMANASFGSKGASLLARNFEANFFLRHMLKDLNLAAETGLVNGCPLPMNALARELFVSANQLGYGDEDYSAVVKVLETLGGQPIGKPSA